MDVEQVCLRAKRISNDCQCKPDNSDPVFVQSPSIPSFNPSLGGWDPNQMENRASMKS